MKIFKMQTACLCPAESLLFSQGTEKGLQKNMDLSRLPFFLQVKILHQHDLMAMQYCENSFELGYFVLLQQKLQVTQIVDAHRLQRHVSCIRL